MTRPLSIAVVAACPFPCERGTPVRIRRLSEALAHRGHDVHVVTYHFGQDHDALPFAVHRTPDVRYYRQLDAGPTYTKLLLLDPLLRRRLRRVLARQRFDIIHAHHLEGLLVALAARRRGGPPIVYDAHTLLGAELPYYNLALPQFVKRWAAGLLDRTLPSRADHIVAVTPTIRDHLLAIEACNTDGATVVSNGVELERFAVSSSTVPGRRAGAELLAYAGNLAAYQGVEELLSALAIVRVKRPQVQLVVVTDSPSEGLRQRAAALGVADGLVVVEGGFATVPGVLKAADLLVNPRVNCPGVPQKLLNYMAAQKPIVSFAGSGQILEHGRSGWLVDGDRPAALADGITKVLRDPALANRLATEAAADVTARYSWAMSADRLETVFTSVIAAARQPSPMPRR